MAVKNLLLRHFSIIAVRNQGVIERSSLTTISAQKETMAELDLSESRTISVSVYDQSGKFISKILTGRSVEAGIQK